MLEALRAGSISEYHVNAIVDAADVIGVAMTPESQSRRSAYEAAVLEIAVAESPNRLRPIARRLAERHSEQSIDERHACARQRRRVFVTELPDGMADLIAHLPAAEAYGIFNRITQMSKVVAQAQSKQQGAHREASAQPGSSNDQRTRQEPHEPHEHLEHLEQCEAPRRTRDAIRADVLSDLLLREFSEAEAGAPATGQQETGSRPRVGHATEFSKIHAQVQIVVPYETLLDRTGPDEGGLRDDASLIIRGVDAGATTGAWTVADPTAGANPSAGASLTSDGTPAASTDNTGDANDLAGTGDEPSAGVEPSAGDAVIAGDLPGTGETADTGDTPNVGEAVGLGGTIGASDTVSAGTSAPQSEGLMSVVSRHGPAILTGYGPIDAKTSRELAASAASWTLVRTAQSSHEVVSVDRYRPSAELRRRLAVRDQHCRFPGCRVPLSRCDIDHTVDAQHGGPTSSDNLAYLCRGHHVVKHHGGWQVDQDATGTLNWRSPTGRQHAEPPPSRVMFRSAA